MSVLETSDVSMENPNVIPTELDDASLMHVAEQLIGEPVPGHDFTVHQEAAKITFQLVEQGT